MDVSVHHSVSWDVCPLRVVLFCNIICTAFWHLDADSEVAKRTEPPPLYGICVTTQEGQTVGGVDNVLVTAASRGIIQREHQRGALFYKNYSQGNPFDNVTKDDLDAYRREVERKEKRRAGKSEMDE